MVGVDGEERLDGVVTLDGEETLDGLSTLGEEGEESEDDFLEDLDFDEESPVLDFLEDFGVDELEDRNRARTTGLNCVSSGSAISAISARSRTRN